MSQKINRNISILLVCLFCFLSFNVDHINAESNIPTNMKKYAENKRLALYVNEDTMEFALYDKFNQNEWFSNPVDKDDKLAKGLNKTGLLSQLTVTLLDTNTKSLSYTNTYVGSVKKKSFGIEKTNKGIKVVYDFQDKEVTIPMYINLEDDYLSIYIPIEEIKEDGSNQVYEIGIAPYFGAGGIEDEGYMFVPDGSGAIINFNNGKQRYNQYRDDIYGADPNIVPNTKIVRKEQVKLNTFGIKKGNDGFLAIVDKGAAVGKITACVSRKVNSFNYAYVNFTLRKKDNYEVDEYGGEKRQILQYEKGDIKINELEVRYYPIDDDNVDYVHMANVYKEYLIDDKGLTCSNNIDSTLYLDLYGAVKKKKPILGIPINVSQPLTTFKEAKLLLEELNTIGIDNITVKYNNVFDDEIDDKLPENIKPDGVLGGTKEFNRLIRYGNDNGVNIFPTVNMTDFTNSGKLFGNSRMSVKKITGVPAKQYHYSIETYQKDTDYQKPWYLLDPNYLLEYVKKVNKRIDKYKIDNIALQSMGNTVYSSYNNKSVGRDSAVDIWTEGIGKIKDNVKELMIDSSNDYGLPYGDYIINVPTDSSRYLIEDKSVPFYQIVLSGLTSYSTTSINLSSEPHKMFLKAMETGSMISFSWIYRDVTTLKDSKLDYLYSANYEAWIDLALEYYTKLKQVYSKSGNHIIVEHNQLSEEVYETVYENGLSVFVNYNDEDISVDGVSLPALSYVVKGGN